jgi:proline iminopeptidase
MRESYVPVDGAELFCREVGEGRPIVVIHGGPDFDHTYLLPDMDRLADSYRLIYYDQRGRGRSRGEVRLEEIDIDRYVEDLDLLRAHLRLDTVAILGHSWGGFVAMQYALRHPGRVSHLILLNTASASEEDFTLMREERRRKQAPHRERLDALGSSPAYRDGDPRTVAEYYRIDFGTTFKRSEDAARLNLTATREDILKGRAIEDRLAEGLLWVPGFTIIPALKHLRTATLVIHGENDFFPVASSAHIAEAIPGARLTTLADSGHFSYIDAPERVRGAIDDFFRAAV